MNELKCQQSRHEIFCRTFNVAAALGKKCVRGALSDALQHRKKGAQGIRSVVAARKSTRMRVFKVVVD